MKNQIQQTFFYLNYMVIKNLKRCFTFIEGAMTTRRYVVKIVMAFIDIEVSPFRCSMK